MHTQKTKPIGGTIHQNESFHFRKTAKTSLSIFNERPALFPAAFCMPLI
jgi:hypothetical protein